MVLKQCLACNVMMVGSCRSCICGHVFEDMKQIGGKRFSGYRAQLYSRLESRRLKTMTKQFQLCEGLGSSDEENKDINGVVIKSPKTKAANKPQFYKTQTKKPQYRRRRRKRLHRGPVSSTSQSLSQKESRQIPPELVARFPNALGEINRRLLEQNVLWARL